MPVEEINIFKEGFNPAMMDPFEQLKHAKEEERTRPPPPPAVIRPFRPSTDLKLVRYLVGASVMEPSSLANQYALFTLPALVLSLGASHLLVTRLTSGYPAYIHNLFYSTPKPLNEKAAILQAIVDSVLLIPLIIAPVIALLALFEWRHRGIFEGEMRRAIGEEDMREIKGYYDVEDLPEPVEEEEDTEGAEVAAALVKKDERPSRKVPKRASSGDEQQQRSGFWVLEYDDRLIGAIALDGRKPGQKLHAVADESASGKKDQKGTAAVSASSLFPDSAEATGVEGGPEVGYALRSRNNKKSSDAPSLSVTPPTPATGSSPSPTFSLSSKTAALPAGTLHIRRFASSLSFRPVGIERDLLDFVAEKAFAPVPSSSNEGEDTTAAATPAPAEQLVITLRPSVQKAFAADLEEYGFELVPTGSELEIDPDAVGVKSKGGNGGLVAKVWPLSLETRTMVYRRSKWEKKTGRA